MHEADFNALMLAIWIAVAFFGSALVMRFSPQFKDDDDKDLIQIIAFLWPLAICIAVAFYILWAIGYIWNLIAGYGND